MMKTKLPRYKPIKFRLERWAEIEALRKLLADERHNDSLSLADAVSEAVKHYSEVLTTAGTPGGKAAAGFGGTQAQPEGVITE